MIWLFPSSTDFREIATVSVYRDVFARPWALSGCRCT